MVISTSYVVNETNDVVYDMHLLYRHIFDDYVGRTISYTICLDLDLRRGRGDVVRIRQMSYVDVRPRRVNVRYRTYDLVRL